MDLRFRHPFSMCIAGPSQAGKTQWTLRLLRNLDSMVTVVPQRVLYCYTMWQPMYSQLPACVTPFEGLPDVNDLKGFNGPQLVVLDDMQAECSKSPMLDALFTKYTHHLSVSTIFLMQNIYCSNTKTARVNTNYMVMFKSPSDKQQVATLGRQLYPSKGKAFVKAYEDATAEPYSYLVIDLTQQTMDDMRLRSHVFPDEYTLVYLIK